MDYYEINFNGIAGPTHVFSGLSHGNLASKSNDGKVSNPKKAALQSLKKMRFCHKLGLKEAIIPPQRRPDLSSLNTIKKSSDKMRILEEIYQYDPKLFKTLFSSSNMWTANAATVSPSLDSEDKKVHFTIANLITNPHRALEAKNTYKYFTQILKGGHFKVHMALDDTMYDEGAANHVRFAPSHGEEGLELFVYGFSNKENLIMPSIYPARQSREAHEQIVRLHDLKFERVVLAQQNPKVIDEGAFHNDVISTGNLNFYLCHEKTFTNTPLVIEELNKKYDALHDEDLIIHEVKEIDVSVQEAVDTYLFNSQILSLPGDEGMLLLAPMEAKENERVYSYLQKLSKHHANPINRLEFYDLNESMQNGGGPACLRLRVVASEEEMQQIKPNVFYSEELHEKLEELIESYYPEEIQLEDFCRPDTLKFIEECFKKYEEIFEIKL